MVLALPIDQWKGPWVDTGGANVADDDVVVVAGEVFLDVAVERGERVLQNNMGRCRDEAPDTQRQSTPCSGKRCVQLRFSWLSPLNDNRRHRHQHLSYRMPRQLFAELFWRTDGYGPEKRVLRPAR